MNENERQKTSGTEEIEALLVIGLFLGAFGVAVLAAVFLPIPIMVKLPIWSVAVCWSLFLYTPYFARD